MLLISFFLARVLITVLLRLGLIYNVTAVGLRCFAQIWRLYGKWLHWNRDHCFRLWWISVLQRSYHLHFPAVFEWVCVVLATDPVPLLGNWPVDSYY